MQSNPPIRQWFVDRREIQEGVLWSPIYFAASTGGATLETVSKYFEQQRAE
ncbi:MAG: transposase [Chloracidobacterium sp.]|nr:transposase [Chloracidobacterium sp.]